jgi:hypothetical protein
MILSKKRRHMDHWSKPEDPQISQQSYSHMILDKDAKYMY